MYDAGLADGMLRISKRSVCHAHNVWYLLRYKGIIKGQVAIRSFFLFYKGNHHHHQVHRLDIFSTILNKLCPFSIFLPSQSEILKNVVADQIFQFGPENHWTITQTVQSFQISLCFLWHPGSFPEHLKSTDWNLWHFVEPFFSYIKNKTFFCCQA